MHYKNIHTLVKEIYKHIYGLSPAILGEVFKISRTLSYNLITHNEFSKRVPNTVKYGIETIFFSSKKLGSSRRKNERMFLFGSF